MHDDTGSAGKPLIDPNCLCGQPHPCAAHGAWTGTEHHPILPGYEHNLAPVNGFAILREMRRAELEHQDREVA